VPDTRTGKTQRPAGSAFEARPQREVLTFNLLHRQFSSRVLRGRQRTPIDPRFVRVVTSDTTGGEHGAEFQELRLLAGAHHIGKPFPRVMIDGLPEPPFGRFGPDETPHFIQLGGALWVDADGTGV